MKMEQWGKDSRSMREAEWTGQGERLDNSCETEAFSRMTPRIQLMARQVAEIRMVEQSKFEDQKVTLRHAKVDILFNIQVGMSSRILENRKLELRREVWVRGIDQEFVSVERTVAVREPAVPKSQDGNKTQG